MEKKQLDPYQMELFKQVPRLAMGQAMRKFSLGIDAEIKSLLRPKIGRLAKFKPEQWVSLLEQSHFKCPTCLMDKPTSELTIAYPDPPFTIRDQGNGKFDIINKFLVQCTECTKAWLLKEKASKEKWEESNVLDSWRKRVAPKPKET